MGGVDPVRDRDIINLELAIADLGVVEKRLDRVKRSARGGDKDAAAEVDLLERLQAALSQGLPTRSIELDDAAEKVLRSFNLLTSKPVLYLANVAEDDLPTGDNRHVQALRNSVAASGE